MDANGEAYLIAGRENWHPHYNLYGGIHPDEKITVIEGESYGDRLTGDDSGISGHTVAAADINGDGIRDIILTAKMANGPAGADSGKVYVIYGRSAFHEPTMQQRRMRLMQSVQPSDRVPNLMIRGMDDDFRLTENGSLQTGDFNGDGVMDLLLGQPLQYRSSLGSGSPGPHAFIVLGERRTASDGLRDIDLNQLYPGVVTRIFFSTSETSLLDGGRGLLAADVSGDGLDDIIVTTPTRNVTSGPKLNAGSVYLIKGRTSLPNKVILDYQNPTAHSDIGGYDTLVLGAAAGDYLTRGGALAAGDVTGDGTPDLIMGAPEASRATESAVGAAYVIGGSSPRPHLTVSFGTQSAIHEGTLNLGTLGAGITFQWPVTLTNRGRAPLHIQSLQLYNDFEKEFTLDSKSIPATIPPLSQVVCTLKVKPKNTALSSRNVKLAAISNDPDTPDFFFVLQANVEKATAPALPSISLDVLSNTSVRARIEPAAFTAEQHVTLRYSQNKNLAQAESRSFVISPGHHQPPAREQLLTDLLPHTTYHYQIRVESPMGTTAGKTASFATYNSAPIAIPDTYPVMAVSGAVIRISLDEHATDADGDSLTVVSVTQPASGGKVVKEKSAVVFQASADFSTLTEAASFIITMGDGYGGTGNLTVQVSPVNASLPTAAIQMSAVGGIHTQPVELPDQTFWNVSEKENWVTIVPSPSESQVEIQVSPNPSLKSRKAQVTIAGQPFTITQAGVLAPQIQSPEEAAFTAYVSRDYEAAIPTENRPVTYRVTGLPPGVICTTGGILQGRPTKAGRYPVKVIASNAASSTTPVTFEIQVLPLDAALAGTFTGITTDGQRIDFVTASTGVLSGKVTRINKAVAFRSQIEFDPGQETPSTFISLPIKGQPEWSLTASFNSTTHQFEGTVNGLPFIAWRSGWAYDKTQATSYAGAYSFRLRNTQPTFDTPHGDGFGTCTVIAKNGTLTVSGRLPDGNAFVTKTLVGDQGQVLIYQPLYANKGFLSGALTITPASSEPILPTSLSSSAPYLPRWQKPSTKDRNYPEGFTLDLEVKGGALPGIAPRGVIMDGQATFQTFTAFERAEAAVFTQDFTITNPSTKGLTNKAVATTPVLNEVALPTLTPTTGAFSGRFVLKTDVAAETRTATFLGQLVEIEGVVRGYGYYLLPELPNPKTSRIYSGGIELRPATSVDQ